jgi:hypothetical protein
VVSWIFAQRELDCNLQSICASIEGSLPENTASWQPCRATQWVVATSHWRTERQTTGCIRTFTILQVRIQLRFGLVQLPSPHQRIGGKITLRLSRSRSVTGASRLQPRVGQRAHLGHRLTSPPSEHILMDVHYEGAANRCRRRKSISSAITCSNNL